MEVVDVVVLVVLGLPFFFGGRVSVGLGWVDDFPIWI